jgi:hypothetical protein
MSPTKETADELLGIIALMALESLDPCLTREMLAQRMKDIFGLADRYRDGDEEVDE